MEQSNCKSCTLQIDSLRRCAGRVEQSGVQQRGAPLRLSVCHIGFLRARKQHHKQRFITEWQHVSSAAGEIRSRTERGSASGAPAAEAPLLCRCTCPADSCLLLRIDNDFEDRHVAVARRRAVASMASNLCANRATPTPGLRHVPEHALVMTCYNHLATPDTCPFAARSVAVYTGRPAIRVVA